MSDSGDAQDLRRAVLGDQAAAARLYERHGRRIFALAYQMLRAPEMAEDVVQDSFLKLWTHAEGILGEQKIVGAWLTRIAANRCIDILRKRREILDDEVPEVASDAPTPEGALHSSQVSKLVAEAMDRLPISQKTALILTNYLGLSNAEAGRCMAISEPAMESLLARGRRNLRAALGNRRSELLGEI